VRRKAGAIDWLIARSISCTSSGPNGQIGSASLRPTGRLRNRRR
jgi:hypothetical protein